MHYLKNNGEALEIRHDNVYNLCPECGKECVVDLAEVVTENGLDLCGTAVYCPECNDEILGKQYENYLRAIDTETGEIAYLGRSVFDIACPDCGKVHEIDLVAACRDCTGLEGIRVRCEDCAAGNMSI